MEDLGIIWLLLLAVFFYPKIQEIFMKRQRDTLIENFSKERKSKVLSLIHRRKVSLFSLFSSEKIEIEDARQILKDIRETDKDTPIDIILHTPGGLFLAAEQIARALVDHPAKVTVIVPHYAMSGGTYIALAADEILMDRYAVLGQVDPQILGLPGKSIQHVLTVKSKNEIDDKTIIMADIAEKALSQIQEALTALLEKRNYDKKKIEEIVAYFSSGERTHDYPITFEKAKALGLPVDHAVPEQVYELLEMYPKPQGMR